MEYSHTSLELLLACTGYVRLNNNKDRHKEVELAGVR